MDFFGCRRYYALAKYKGRGSQCPDYIGYSLNETAKLATFFYLLICEVTKKKVNFCFYKQYSHAITLFIRERAIFAQNISLIF